LATSREAGGRAGASQKRRTVIRRLAVIFLIAAAIQPSDAQAQWSIQGADTARGNAAPWFDHRPPYGILWSRGNLGRSADRTNGFIEHGSTVGGGRVYVQVINGTVSALSASSGKVLWWRKPGQRAASAPAYSGRRRAVVVHNLRPGGRLSVLDARTGRRRWSRYTGGGEASPLVLESGIVVATTAGAVAKYSWSGRRLWRRSLGWKITGSVASAGGRLVVVDYGGWVTALQHRNGRVLWRSRTGGRNYATPTLYRARVFVASQNGRLYGFSARTGRLAWSRQIGSWAPSNTAPAVAGGRVFAASFNGWVYCFRWKGSRCWRKRFAGAVKAALATTEGNLVWVCHRKSDERRVRRATLRVLGARAGRTVWTFSVCSHAPLSADSHRAYVHGFGRIRALTPIP
jgi:outer membrane protein assembly factor BamB